MINIKSVRKFIFVLYLFTSYSFLSCRSVRTSHNGRNKDKFEITIIQVNDVYEIAPLNAGRSGGMARVATLKKESIQKNPNTILVMAGDFVSPSVYNSLKYRDTAIRGKQMIDAMNTAGFDLAIFGNHEFDIKASELKQRINESNFTWVSSNSFFKEDGHISQFVKIKDGISTPLPKTFIKSFHDRKGNIIKVGFIGLTIPFNQADFVSYTDPLSSAISAYNEIRDSCNAVIAITHQLIADDRILAEKLPGLAMIIGGHEHEKQFEKIGNVYITKADANAKSAFILRLKIDKKNKTSKVFPEFKLLDESVALDHNTGLVVQKWVNIANNNYSSLGFNATNVVIPAGDPLEGREVYIRNGPTNLTQLIVHAMETACPLSDLVMVNSGSIRVDDIIQPPVTQYDIIRTLPFGGSIREALVKGNLIIKVLNAGLKNKGIGGFLQYSSFVKANPAGNSWLINNIPIEPQKIYRVAFSDFLITGKEANLGFLNKDNPDLIKLYDEETLKEDPRSDIRLAIIRYLEKKGGKLE